MTTRTEVSETLQLCGGTLTTWLKGDDAGAYDKDPEGEDEFWVVFQRDGTEAEIRSADELYRVLGSQGYELPAEVTRLAPQLAEITAFLLGTFRAVTSFRVYGFLEKYFQISIVEHLPRVDGHVFRFLLGDFSKGTQRTTLFNIAVDLRTGAITREPFKR